jgi:hypothetical protein
MRSPCYVFVYVQILNQMIDFLETSYEPYATGGQPNVIFWIYKSLQ